MQLSSSSSILWGCLSLGLEWKLIFSSLVATAEFSIFAGILSAALSQHHKVKWGHYYNPGGTVIKNVPANAGDKGDKSSIPGSGRSPGERNSNPLQYSCPENSTEKGALQATAHGITKESDMTEHRHTHGWSLHLMGLVSLGKDTWVERAYNLERDYLQARKRDPTRNQSCQTFVWNFQPPENFWFLAT